MSATTSRAQPVVRPKIRVAIVNDYSLVVHGLRTLLESESDAFDVITVAQGSLPEPGEVDLILYDVFAQAGSIAEISARAHAKVVIFTETLAPDAEVGALREGVSGYVFKGVSAGQLCRALVAVHQGSSPVVDLKPDPDVADTTRRWPGDGHDLSERESEIVALICQGRTNQQIAEQLFLSINSIKTYIRLAYRKMDVDNRSKAVAWGLRHGFTGPS